MIFPDCVTAHAHVIVEIGLNLYMLVSVVFKLNCKTKKMPSIRRKNYSVYFLSLKNIGLIELLKTEFALAENCEVIEMLKTIPGSVRVKSAVNGINKFLTPALFKLPLLQFQHRTEMWPNR